MKDLIASVEFWVAMVFAVILKLMASKTLTPLGAVATTVSAVTGALVFTEPALRWLDAGSEYQNAVAAIIALMCEHLARQFMTIKVADIVKIWRGK